MTEKDLLSISSFVLQVPPSEFEPIERKHADWLQRLKGTTPWEAVTVIQNALRAIEEPRRRLRRVARMGCWLIPHDTLGRWSLYRHQHFARYCFVTGLYRSLAYALGSDMMTIGPSRRNARCSCIMVQDPKSMEGDHNYACLCVWNTMPFLAVHATGDKFEPVINAAVGAVMRTPSEKLRRGTYPSLRAAFVRACIYMEPAVATENLEEDGKEQWLWTSPDQRDNSSGSLAGSEESSFLGLEYLLHKLLSPCNSEDGRDGVRDKSKSIFEDVASDYSSSQSSVMSCQSSPKHEDLGVYQIRSKQDLQETTRSSQSGDEGAAEWQERKYLICRDCKTYDLECPSRALQLNTDALHTWYVCPACVKFDTWSTTS